MEKDSNRPEVLFLHGKLDELISYKHSITIMEKWSGKVSSMFFNETHNSPRGEEVMEYVSIFI